MKRNTIKIIKWSSSLLMMVIIINLLRPTRIISYYGWIEIADKTVVEDTYYITTDLGEGLIEIEMGETESFLYKETPQKSEEVVITDVWGTIERTKNISPQWNIPD